MQGISARVAVHSMVLVDDEVYERARAGQDEWVLSVVSNWGVREATTDSQKIVFQKRRKTLESDRAEFIGSQTSYILCELIVLNRANPEQQRAATFARGHGTRASCFRSVPAIKYEA